MAATLRPVLGAAVADLASFSVTVFDASTSLTTGLFLGPGIPIAIGDEGGEVDWDCVARWTAEARAGHPIAISCVDSGCDCVLRDAGEAIAQD